MPDQQAASSPPVKPGDPIDLESSVAGEEDPGASIDLAVPSRKQAPAGAAGAGRKTCPQCGGSGRLGGSSCPACQGSGKVDAGTGGA